MSEFQEAAGLQPQQSVTALQCVSVLMRWLEDSQPYFRAQIKEKE